MIKNLIYIMKKIFKIKLIKGLLKNKNKKYEKLFVDIDYKKNFLTELKFINFQHFFKIEHIKIFETKKGYHLYITFRYPQTFFYCIKLMQELKSDKAYIKRFIYRGKTALFKYRRGEQNEKYIYSLINLYKEV